MIYDCYKLNKDSKRNINPITGFYEPQGFDIVEFEREQRRNMACYIPDPEPIYLPEPTPVFLPKTESIDLSDIRINPVKGCMLNLPYVVNDAGINRYHDGSVIGKINAMMDAEVDNWIMSQYR